MTLKKKTQNLKPLILIICVTFTMLLFSGPFSFLKWLFPGNVTRHYLALATWSFLGERKPLSSCVYFSMGYFDVLGLVGSACIFKSLQTRREQIKIAFLGTEILAVWGRFGGKKGSFAELLKWQLQTLPWWQNNDWHLWEGSRFTQLNLHFSQLINTSFL